MGFSCSLKYIHISNRFNGTGIQGASPFRRLAIRILSVTIQNSSELLLSHALRLASHEIFLRPGALLLSILPCTTRCNNLLMFISHDFMTIAVYMPLLCWPFLPPRSFLQYVAISNFLLPGYSQHPPVQTKFRRFTFLVAASVEPSLQCRIIGLRMRTNNILRGLFQCQSQIVTCENSTHGVRYFWLWQCDILSFVSYPTLHLCKCPDIDTERLALCDRETLLTSM